MVHFGETGSAAADSAGLMLYFPPAGFWSRVVFYYTRIDKV